MSLKAKSLLYILILHGLGFSFVYILLKDDLLWFFVGEAILVLSFLTALALFRAFNRPIQRMRIGAEAIRDRDFYINFVETGSPEMDQLGSLYNEMIQRIRQERKEIAEQHFFMEKLIEASPTGIIVLDYDRNIVQINPAMLQMLDLKEAPIRKNITQLSHPLLEKMQKLQAGDSGIISLQGLYQYKCQMAQFIHRGFPRQFFVVEELSKELLMTEKNAYGKVIRMMAHEVNNSIGAINSILNSLKEMEQSQTRLDTEEMIEVLEVATERNDHLNQFMKNFASVIRLPEPKPVQMDLHTWLERNQTWIDIQARERNIQIDWKYSEKAIPVKLDLAQMEQALGNILKNAMEAIEQNGIIRIQTQAKPPVLKIYDNGPGIPPEVQENLFSPFFSTKSQGQGIGLTLVREILYQHGFRFKLNSGDGWTCFEIEFS